MELIINNNILDNLSAEEIKKIYQVTLSGKSGKIIIADLAEVSGMYRSNFVKDSSNYTSYLEGQRALFLYICSKLENNINNIKGKE